MQSHQNTVLWNSHTTKYYIMLQKTESYLNWKAMASVSWGCHNIRKKESKDEKKRCLSQSWAKLVSQIYMYTDYCHPDSEKILVDLISFTVSEN